MDVARPRLLAGRARLYSKVPVPNRAGRRGDEQFRPMRRGVTRAGGEGGHRAWARGDRTARQITDRPSGLADGLTPPQRRADGTPPVRPRVGLALAGGGALAAAHFGVIEALSGGGIPIDCVAGVSAGALVAALWADGCDPSDGTRFPALRLSSWRDVNLAGLLSPNRPGRLPGIMRGRRLQRFCARACDVDDIVRLQRPCALIAADLAAGQEVVFANRRPVPTNWASPSPAPCWMLGGETARVLHGAMAIPVLFPPVPYDEFLLADGGLVDHVPAWAARALGADYVVGVDLTSWHPVPAAGARLSTVAVASRALKLSQRSIQVGEPADLLISPDFAYEAGLLDLRLRERHHRVGREAARRVIGRLRSELALAGGSTAHALPG